MSPSHSGLRGSEGLPLRKNTPEHSRRGGPCRRINLRRFAGYPTLAPGGLRKPLGCDFPCNLEIINTAPTFCKEAGVLCPRPIRDCGKERGQPFPRKKSPALWGLSRPSSERFAKALVIGASYAIPKLQILLPPSTGFGERYFKFTRQKGGR